MFCFLVCVFVYLCCFTCVAVVVLSFVFVCRSFACVLLCLFYCTLFVPFGFTNIHMYGLLLRPWKYASVFYWPVLCCVCSFSFECVCAFGLLLPCSLPVLDCCLFACLFLYVRVVMCSFRSLCLWVVLFHSLCFLRFVGCLFSCAVFTARSFFVGLFVCDGFVCLLRCVCVLFMSLFKRVFTLSFCCFLGVVCLLVSVCLCCVCFARVLSVLFRFMFCVCVVVLVGMSCSFCMSLSFFRLLVFVVCLHVCCCVCVRVFFVCSVRLFLYRYMVACGLLGEKTTQAFFVLMFCSCLVLLLLSLFVD